MRTRLLFAALAVALGGCSASDGTDGMDGLDGIDGTDGADGAKGAKGAPGADGVDGADGANGTDGVDGAKGAKGNPGADGVDGADGADGANGQDGNDIILSETARAGLDLAEVPLDLDGLDADGIESVGRGAYLANAVADCTGCHTGPAGYLSGNNDFPIGGFTSGGVPCTVGDPGCIDSHVFTRNLTPDPITGLKLSEEQFVEALRTGRDFNDANGLTSLIVMPWPQLRWMTERDLRDVYHYLRRIPAISNAVQADVKPTFPPAPSPYLDGGGDPTVANFTDGDVDRALPSAFDMAAGRPTTLASEPFDGDNVLRGLAISPLDDDTIVAALSATDQWLYGRGSYIVNGPALCNECHTKGGRNLDGTVRTATFLAGGQAFGLPSFLQPIIRQVRTMSGNLTGKDFGFDQPFSVFLDTWLSGMSFTMAEPHPLGFPMPFELFRNMMPSDKAAVYTYITTIQKNGLVTGDSPHQAPARYCTGNTDCNTGASETCAAVVIAGSGTGECIGKACAADSDCDACQTCDVGVTNTCLAEDPASACVTSSF